MHCDAHHVPARGRTDEGAGTHASGFVIAAAAAGYGLTCLLNIVAARILPASEYGAFSAAIAIVAIICTVATLGLEKCALRILPEYLSLAKQDKTRGYIIFGVVICVLFGALCAVGAFVLYDTTRVHDENLAALSQMLWFVPAITLFMFALEVSTSLGSWMASTLIYRLLVPAGATAAIAILALFESKPSLSATIDWYGTTWIISLVVLVVIIMRRLPAAVRRSTSLFEPRDWLTQSVGYLGFSLIMTLFTQGAVVMLEVVKGDRVGVGMMSSALQVAGFVIIAQTATMRIYAPQLARLVANQDIAGERALMRSRGRFMIAVCVVFLAVIALFGRELLSLFGPSYSAAYPALLCLSIGNCSNTILGFAPAILQYHGSHKLTLTIAGVGTAVALIAMSICAKEGTYLDVSYAYAASLIAMYIGFQLAVLRRRRQFAAK